MAWKRCLIEIGMGVDLHGRDYTKAAQRALADAMSRNRLYFVSAVGSKPQSVWADVTIASPEPDAVDPQAVMGMLPYGQGQVNVIKGGLEIANEHNSDGTIITNAVVMVRLDM